MGTYISDFPLKVLPNATDLQGQHVLVMSFEVKFVFHPFSSRSELTLFCELQFQIPISEKALRVIEELQRALSSYETTIATSAEAGIDMETKDFEYKWTYVQSIFFTSTIITTVGRNIKKPICMHCILYVAAFENGYCIYENSVKECDF